MVTDTHMHVHTHTRAHTHTNGVVLYPCRLLAFGNARWIRYAVDSMLTDTHMHTHTHTHAHTYTQMVFCLISVGCYHLVRLGEYDWW